MATEQVVHEVLPKAGLVVSEKGNLTETLCKPKIMPLKSITLIKLEEMEAKLVEFNKQQRSAFPQAQQQEQDSMAVYAAQARHEDALMQAQQHSAIFGSSSNFSAQQRGGSGTLGL